MEKFSSINNEISRMSGVRGVITFILALLAHRPKLGLFLLRLRPYGSKTNVFALLLPRCGILGVSAAVSVVYEINFIMIQFSDRNFSGLTSLFKIHQVYFTTIIPSINPCRRKKYTSELQRSSKGSPC